VNNDLNHVPDAFGVSIDVNAYYLMNTNNATNPFSAFPLSLSVPASNTVDLGWLAAPGVRFQVEYTTNLNDPVWLTAPGTVRVLLNQGYFLTPMVLPCCFYRVLGTY
jgi:hypothetical protein